MTNSTHKKNQPQRLPTINEILNSKDNLGIQKFNSLNFKQQLELVLNSTGKDRLELLYHSDRFNSLVKAMPAPEVLFTCEEVGMDMAMPIIAATSHEQFTFLTDFLCWNKDEINPKAIVDWLQNLAECGEDKIQEWLAKVDPEWFILILKSTLNIYKCDDEGDPPDIQDANYLYTIDGMYYFEFLDSQAIDPLQTILLIFRDDDPDGFRGIMEAAIWTDIHEMELFASHFRQSRMSEWGFPEYDDAIEIYQYFTLEHRKKVVRELEKGLKEWSDLSNISHYPVKLEDQTGFLTTCLKNIDDEKVMARFSKELVLLANKVQVADRMDNIGGLENIRVSSRKAMGYVTLGLAELSSNDPRKAAELIGRVHTERLFQVGFSQVEDLARKANQLIKYGRLAENPGAIDQLKSPDREILKGLLNSSPKFYMGDETVTTNAYIDFHEPNQVERCLQALKRIEKEIDFNE